MPLSHLFLLAEGVRKDGKGNIFTAASETTHDGQSLTVAFRAKSENKEQRIIPALVTTIAEEENSAGRDLERLSRSSSYLSLGSAVLDV